MGRGKKLEVLREKLMKRWGLNARELRGSIAAGLLCLLGALVALLPQQALTRPVTGSALAAGGVLLAIVVQAFGRPR